MNTPKVYWKASHKAWYANIGPASAKGNRRPVKLLAGPNDKAAKKLATEALWRKLAADGLPEGEAANLESDPLVSDLFRELPGPSQEAFQARDARVVQAAGGRLQRVA